MNPELLTRQVSCPYCGENFETVVDTSMMGEEYTEDCYVCCRPIIFALSEGFSGEIDLHCRAEQD